MFKIINKMFGTVDHVQRAQRIATHWAKLHPLKLGELQSVLGCSHGVVMPAEGMPMVVDIKRGREVLAMATRQGKPSEAAILVPSR